MRFSESKRRTARRLCAALVPALAGVSVATCGDATAPKLPALTALSFGADSLAFTPGDSLSPELTVTRADGELADASDARWTSRDPAIVSIPSPGVVRGVAAGRAWVVAENGSVRDSVLMIVSGRLVIQLSTHVDTVRSLGDTLALRATFAGAAGGQTAPVTWGSRDTSVVVVTQRGAVIARRDGATYVLALEDGGGLDSDRVVVRQRVVKLDMSAGAVTRPLLRTTQLAAIPRDARGNAVASASVSWSASDTAIASVDASGLVTARAVGADTIRASSGATASQTIFTVTPMPALRVTRDTVDVGVGQYSSGADVPVERVLAPGHDPEEAFTLALSISDTTVARVKPALFPEPNGRDTSERILPIGSRPGTAVVTVSADRYVATSFVLRVSTARLLMPSAKTVVYSPYSQAGFSVDVADSLGHRNMLGQAATFRLRSSDTSVIAPNAPSFDATQYVGTVFPSVAVKGVGTAWLVMDGDGYRADSTRFTVVAPKLEFAPLLPGGADVVTVGVGQTTFGTRIGAPGEGVADTTVVALTQSRPDLARVPGTVRIDHASGATTTEFVIDGLASGADTIIASATGYSPDTLVVLVTRPMFRLGVTPTMYGMTQQFVSPVFVDSAGVPQLPTAGTRRAVITSSDPAVLRPTPDTVLFDLSSADPRVQVDAVGLGTATLTVRDVDGVAPPATSSPITVVANPLLVGFGEGRRVPADLTVGMHQQLPDSERVFFYLAQNDLETTLAIRSTDTSIVRPSADTVTVSRSSGSIGFVNVMGGSRAGSAWIVASATGIATDSIRVTVGKPALQLVSAAVGPNEDPKRFFVVQAVDQQGRPRVTTEPVALKLWSSNSSVVLTATDTLTIPSGASSSNRLQILYGHEGEAAVRVIDPRSTPFAYEPTATRLIVIDALGRATTTILPSTRGAPTIGGTNP